MKIPIVGTIEPDGRVTGLPDQECVTLTGADSSTELDDVADESMSAADLCRELADKLPTGLRVTVQMAANSLDAAAIRLYGVGEVLRDRDGR